MQLYNISEEDIWQLIEKALQNEGKKQGKIEIVDDSNPSKEGYPTKVVYTLERELITVITAYPLKRGRNENIL